MAFELRRSGTRLAALALVLVSLTACAGTRERVGGMFGRDKAPKTAVVPANAIGVNGFLWRATLDTLAFMPLVSADPYGGVIITDWYADPAVPNERFKATAYILDTRLRADGLNVSVNKQVKDASGAWVDSAPAEQTETDIENAILTRARQLRLSNISG
jgi:hypothetical protein